MVFNEYVCAIYTPVPTTQCPLKHNALLEAKAFSRKENIFSTGKFQDQGSPGSKKAPGK